MASLLDLARHGQSVWLDFIDRNLMTHGGLQRLVDSGITGVTTNPSIFNKAIGGSRDYDEAIRELLEQNHEIDPAQLCEALMVGDVQMAADVLRPVYERTARHDGELDLTSEPGRGTSVSVRLPVSACWSGTAASPTSNNRCG